jgi:hypothetical protein
MASDPLGAAPGYPSRRAAGRARRGSILPGPGGPRLSAPTDRRGRLADRARDAGLGLWGRAARFVARFETSTGFEEVRHGESPPSGVRGGCRGVRGGCGVAARLGEPRRRRICWYVSSTIASGWRLCTGVRLPCRGARTVALGGFAHVNCGQTSTCQP